MAELAEVFNFTNISDGSVLLDRLEYGKVDDTKQYFIDFVKNLPVLRNFGVPAIPEEEVQIKMIKGPRRKANNVLAGEVKSGAWGNVHFGKNYVYKEVRVDSTNGEHLNNYYRDVLCEVVIQVILSCDPVHSDKIPKIINVFKRTPEAKSLWIQMEKMDRPNTARKLMDYLGRPGRPMWQLGYNFRGEYLHNQFTFPFATPKGFIELLKKYVNDDEDVTSFVEETLGFEMIGGYTKRKIVKTEKPDDAKANNNLAHNHLTNVHY